MLYSTKHRSISRLYTLVLVGIGWYWYRFGRHIMEPEFWQDKWERNELGFHQCEVQELLTTYWPMQSVESDSWVFVPLCGKSLDMVWLVRQGYRIIGSELSELAAQQFFQERGLTPVINRVQDETGHLWTVYQAGDGRLIMIVGDYFRLSKSLLQSLAGASIQSVYDRAALVAMPRPMRKQYVDQLKSIVPKASIFLVSLEFDHQGNNPPFPVFRGELEELAKGAFDIKELGRQDSDVKGKPAIEIGYHLITA